jgi:nucleotide-binding universal stress UspA family protein
VDELVAASHELDLLVLGSRGYGPLRRLLLGRVGSGVLRGAACPVLAIPRCAPEHIDRPVASMARGAVG